MIYSVQRDRGDQILRSFVDPDSDIHIARLAVVIIVGCWSDGDLHIAEAIIFIESFDCVLIAVGKTVAVTAVAQANDPLGLDKHAFPNVAESEVAAALNV